VLKCLKGNDFMDWTEFDRECMRRALDTARKYEGWVEPNPMVGCVLARNEQVLSTGAHERFGGAHAEIMAIQQVAAAELRGATAYVTLEPCCHVGKTPPCTNALISAGIARVVIAQRDPFPAVAGGGIAQLQAAGIEVTVGCCADEARQLNAPYLKLVQQGLPWVIAKWAMSLDGKIATHTGHSQWISSAPSRAMVHDLRGRVDAILIGCGTALADDPLLTARPAGARQALRVVLDSQARLPLTSQLVRTAPEIPVMVVTSSQASDANQQALTAAGCEIWQTTSSDPVEQCCELLRELGRRRCTNVLVEGGSAVLGNLFDASLIDEVHAFIAPKLIGGAAAKSPLGGKGLLQVPAASAFEMLHWQTLEEDLYFHGRLHRKHSTT
jgi:diaminohydroxyphosphoribosylaminopyrimidine deaminase / 5-amino-6-(5-phosphoribosylamino)uracil reductase